MGLYSKIIDVQKLSAAWGKVKSNKPACGADNITWEQFDVSARESIKQLNTELKEHQYYCRPVKLVSLYKGEKTRQIALYCMRDKVVQQSTAAELTKIYDSKFSEKTYAYRPNKSALSAVREIEKVIREGRVSYALKIDIHGFFDNIVWEKLEEILRRTIREDDVINLIRQSVTAKALQDGGELREKRVGVYQGSSLAPILSNIYLMDFDRKQSAEADFFIRYSDDILILDHDEVALKAKLSRVQSYFNELGLTISEKKTRLCPIRDGFEYLGYYFNDKGKAIPGKAEEQLAERLEMAWMLNRQLDTTERLTKMGEILEGWEQYFRGEREAKDILEYATVVYMVHNKPELKKLALKRRQFKNEYRDIALYLAKVWKGLGFNGLSIYEAEEILGTADESDLTTETQLTGGNPTLAERLDNVLHEENKETLTELMQTYADLHQFSKASLVAERITEIETGGKSEPPHIQMDEGVEQAGLTITEAEVDQFMDLFCGREDMYAAIDFLNGRKNRTTIYQPLSVDVVREHVMGESTVATFVQRTNCTAKFFIADIDVSRKVILEAREEPEKFERALKKAAETAALLVSDFSRKGVRPRVEFSGGRGYHVWFFFSEWIPVRYLNMLQDICEESINGRDNEISVEFFPNKARLKAGSPGQCIKLPLGIANARGRRSVLLEDDFTECAALKKWMDNTARYPLNKLKRVLAAQANSNESNVVVREVNPDLSVFSELTQNCRAVLEKCSLMRYLCRKAYDTGYLTHFERLSVLYVFGHMGDEGKAFIHTVMSFTLNYQHSVTDKFIRKCPEKPISCIKLRDQYKSITAEYGCSCVFKQKKDCYPSPVLHAITQSRDEINEVTLPISRTVTKEKKQEISEEMNIHKRAAGIVSRIVDYKKQRRRFDQNIKKLERELEEIFDSEKIDSLELDIGELVRVKRDDGYEWKIEI